MQRALPPLQKGGWGGGFLNTSRNQKPSNLLHSHFAKSGKAHDNTQNEYNTIYASREGEPDPVLSRPGQGGRHPAPSCGAPERQGAGMKNTLLCGERKAAVGLPYSTAAGKGVRRLTGNGSWAIVAANAWAQNKNRPQPLAIPRSVSKAVKLRLGHSP
jgi:hypothetical protein